MSIQEDGTYDEAAARRSQRRKQAVVGVAGAAAVLGGAAFFITEAVTRDDTTAEPPVVVAPVASERSASTAARAPQKPPTPPASREPAAMVSRKPSPIPSPSPTPSVAASVEQRIRDARKAAAEDGVPVQRGLPGTTPPPGLQVSDSGNLKEGGTLRVVSAQGDLTGYRELGWVAGKGEKVGDASCTQTFRFAGNAEPQRKPNLLVCWRTSDARSVYTVTVDLDGKPSKAASVAALARQWSRLG